MLQSIGFYTWGARATVLVPIAALQPSFTHGRSVPALGRHLRRVLRSHGLVASDWRFDKHRRMFIFTVYM